MKIHLALLCADLLSSACGDGGQTTAPALDASTSTIAVSPSAAPAPESAEAKVATCNIETVAGVPFKGAVPPLSVGGKVRDAAYLDSGFSVDVPAEGMAPGDYYVTVGYSDRGVCDVMRLVTVK